MLKSNNKQSPIHGEIRLKNEDLFEKNFSKFIKYKSDEYSCVALYFEFKNVRFRLTYNSTYSHIQFFAWSCFGWKNADSIYDYANKEFIRELGIMLSKRFHCCVRLSWFRRLEKGCMRFRDGNVWETDKRMPSERPFEKKDSLVYFTELLKPFRERTPYTFNSIVEWVGRKNETNKETNKENNKE